MSNINIELKGYTKEVIDRMVEKNYVKTKTEAIRLALFEFDQMHGLTDDELYSTAAEKILKNIKVGKEKVHEFKLPK
jgi:Arc/MetJ-type ribon-helix-helix transcriptional regulator